MLDWNDALREAAKHIEQCDNLTSSKCRSTPLNLILTSKQDFQGRTNAQRLDLAPKPTSLTGDTIHYTGDVAEPLAHLIDYMWFRVARKEDTVKVLGTFGWYLGDVAEGCLNK